MALMATFTSAVFRRIISPPFMESTKTQEYSILVPRTVAEDVSCLGLICSIYDSKGNAVIYKYKAEDSAGIYLLQAKEYNRSAQTRSSNRYLKVIKYRNRAPNRDSEWCATDPRLLPDKT